MELIEEHTFDQCYATVTKWDCDNILLSHVSSYFKDNIAFSASYPSEMVRLHFGLKGNYSMHHQQLGQQFDFIGGHHNIMYSKSFDVIIENKTPELETFDIQFPKDLFIRYTENANDALKAFGENILNGKSTLLSEKWQAIRLPIQNTIAEIINCRYEGQLKKLFLLSKSIELLVLSAEAYRPSESQNKGFVKTTADKEKLIAVKDLINKSLQTPLSLSEVSRLVGLNEYKLKRGFKEMFNTTVFGYMADQRLNLATQYILDTEKSIAEISFELNYASPQHFNSAFKKKFGTTPLSVRNNPANVTR